MAEVEEQGQVLAGAARTQHAQGDRTPARSCIGIDGARHVRDHRPVRQEAQGFDQLRALRCCEGGAIQIGAVGRALQALEHRQHRICSERCDGTRELVGSEGLRSRAAMRSSIFAAGA